MVKRMIAFADVGSHGGIFKFESGPVGNAYPGLLQIYERRVTPDLVRVEIRALPESPEAHHEELLRRRAELARFNAFVAGFKAHMGREPKFNEYDPTDLMGVLNSEQKCFALGQRAARRIYEKDKD